jgi:hypothetical protein
MMIPSIRESELVCSAQATLAYNWTFISASAAGDREPMPTGMVLSNPKRLTLVGSVSHLISGSQANVWHC